MDKTVGVLKNGWHPQKKEGRSIRGEVTGLVGRGKKQEPSTRSNNHVARPLASLQNPDSFGPPPKNANYYGPDTTGLGAPLKHEPRTHPREDDVKPPAPPVPYRSNTTGLSTAGLLPPPRPTDTSRDATMLPFTKPKPQLPPRLPPRGNSQSATTTSPPPPPYTENSDPPSSRTGYLNQNASDRLARSGITVPSFGIGQSQPALKAIAPPPVQRDTTTQAQPAQTFSSPSIRGLRNQFSSLSTATTPSQAEATTNTPSTGTTWAQKQAALNTASQLQRDPTKVNSTDARAAFSTANNFRQRHGEEVARGLSVGQDMNQKYGLVNKAQGFANTAEPQVSHTEQQGAVGTNTSAQPADGFASQAAGAASRLGFKKAPPPPPPLRRPTDPVRSPPPIPVSSKPR